MGYEFSPDNNRFISPFYTASIPVQIYLIQNLEKPLLVLEITRLLKNKIKL